MFDSLKAFTGLMTVLVVGILLCVFRAEIRKLVDWLVQFKRIAKTKEGYSLENAREPERAPVPVVDAAREAVTAGDATVTPSSEPDASDTWFKAVHEKRYDAAVSLVEAEQERMTDPDSMLGNRCLIGYIKFQQNSTAGLAYFGKLIQEDPTRDRPYDWLAMSYLWRDLPDKCLAVIERGLAAAQTKARLLDTKSDCLLRLGRVDDAIAAAVEGVRDDASYVPNYTNLARLHLRKDDKVGAKSWHLRAFEASDGNEQVLAEYAKFLAENDYNTEAILRHRDLVNRQPSNPTYCTLAGNAYLTAGLNSHALRAYQKANELAGEKEGWIIANIGNIFKNVGFYAGAIKHLRRALDLDPDSQYAHERLAYAQQLEADEDKKLESLIDEARQTLNKEGTPSQP